MRASAYAGKLEDQVPNLIVDLATAKRVASRVNHHFKLRAVDIKISTRSKSRAYGRYTRGGTLKRPYIRMYPVVQGNNLRTLLHELAHHLQRTRAPFEAGHHGPAFKQAHVDVLRWFHSQGFAAVVLA